MPALATTLQAFFTDRLVRQRQVSPNTLCAYRDTLRLLLVFASDRKGNAPSKLDIDDLDASLVGAFLNDLEQQRKNSVRTRNARLAAIRSLFRYAALRHPEHASAIERVLAIPPKRFERRLVTFLTEAEINALLAAPDRSNWTGRRDTALFSLAVQTGLRASELTGLCCADVHLGSGAHVSCNGKECPAYCISSRHRNETTIIHPYRQACDLAFSSADILQAVRTGIGLGPYTVANGAGHVGPMSEPYPA
jgi:integrase/recombinase XerD